MLKGKNPYIFVRFGGLDLKTQKGFTNDKSKIDYHTPPAPRGIYAMPKIAQEFFLISSIDKTQESIFCKIDNLKNKKNNGENYWKDKLKQIRKEFKKNEGTLWHHLGEYVKQKDVLDTHGSWVKTDIKVWAKAFSKMRVKLAYGRSEYDLQNKLPFDINTKFMGFYSKDHCEVFFDEKVS